MVDTSVTVKFPKPDQPATLSNAILRKKEMVERNSLNLINSEITIMKALDEVSDGKLIYYGSVNNKNQICIRSELHPGVCIYADKKTIRNLKKEGLIVLNTKDPNKKLIELKCDPALSAQANADAVNAKIKSLELAREKAEKTINTLCDLINLYR